MRQIPLSDVPTSHTLAACSGAGYQKACLSRKISVRPSNRIPKMAAEAVCPLGLTPRQRLWQIDLPLALPVILAGIQTAAVMSVGTAAIATFIGTGGYGERIAVRLALNDNDMLLAGAIPAAAFALVTQGLFEVVEWVQLRRRWQAETNR
jgi:ABC-type proline/glycine betaine transport system permease subunit